MTQTRIDDRFTVTEEMVVQVQLLINGKPVVNTDGKPVIYPSVDDATYVARNWDDYHGDGRALTDLSDAELEQRARRLWVLDSER